MFLRVGLTILVGNQSSVAWPRASISSKRPLFLRVHHHGVSHPRRQTGGTQPPLSAPDSSRRCCRMTTRSPRRCLSPPTVGVWDGNFSYIFRSPPLFVLNTTSASSDSLFSCLSNLSIYPVLKDQHNTHNTHQDSRLFSPIKSTYHPPPPSPCRPAIPGAANAARCSSSAPVAPTANTFNAPTASNSLHISTSLVAWWSNHTPTTHPGYPGIDRARLLLAPGLLFTS